MREGTTHRRADLPFLLALFLGALALRLLYLSEIRHNPFYDAPVVDAKVFLEQARLIAAYTQLGESGRAAEFQRRLETLGR